MRRVSVKKYRIKLSPDERIALEEVRDKGSHKASKFKRALVFLLADEGEGAPSKKDTEIAQSTGLTTVSIERLRKRCCEIGPLGALDPKPRDTPPRKIKITGEVEAHITQLACSEPPEGRVRWTLHLLAQRLVEIEVIDSISHNSVGLVLKKANLNHGVKNAGVSRRKKTPRS
jgi:hypothetical protein